VEALAHIRVACCEPSPNLGPDRHHRCSIMRITHIGTFWSTITRTPFTGTLSIRRQALPVRSPHTPQQLGQNPSVLDVLAGPPKRRPGSARSVAKSPTRLRDPTIALGNEPLLVLTPRPSVQHTFVVWRPLRCWRRER